MKTDSFKRPRYITLAILSIVPLTGMGVDLYAPSLPWIAQDLHTSVHLVKLTISAYLIGYAIAPILAGTFSDIKGRKLTLKIGMFLYVLSCLMIIFFPSIDIMMTMRVIQGIGAGFLGVVFRAMATDCYQPGPELKKMGASMSTVWALGPVIAPFIGGYLQHYISWKANFWLYVFYGTYVFCLAFIIPETNHHFNTWDIKRISKEYRDMLTHRLFWGLVILIGITYTMIVFFNVVGPFIIQTVLHHSAVFFGYMAFIMGIATLSANLLNRLVLLHYICVQTLIATALMLMTLFSLILLILGVTQPVLLLAYIIPLFVILFMGAIVFANSLSTVLGLFPHMAGAAGALVGLLFSGFAAIATGIGSFLLSDTQVPIAIAYLILCVMGLIAFYVLANKKIRNLTI